MTLQTFPFDDQGAARDAAQYLRPGLSDHTASPRFGLKGPGTADWFAAQGIALPQVNRTISQDALRICRFGTNDVMVIAKADAIAAFRRKWEEATQSPKGYSSWKEEAWAWLRLYGPFAHAALSRLTAVDLRNNAFAADQVLQTRVAHQDAVLMHAADEEGFDLFFDIASVAQVSHDVAQAFAQAEALQ